MWIKKGSDAIDQAAHAVQTSLGKRFASAIQLHLVEVAREAGVAPEKIKAMFDNFSSQPWIEPPGIHIPDPSGTQRSPARWHHL